ncbi:MAG: hypothetical protein QXO40_00185 [Candidatus Aenigmatarchaeota archaeon]
MKHYEKIRYILIHFGALCIRHLVLKYIKVVEYYEKQKEYIYRLKGVQYKKNCDYRRIYKQIANFLYYRRKHFIRKDCIICGKKGWYLTPQEEAIVRMLYEKEPYSKIFK